MIKTPHIIEFYYEFLKSHPVDTIVNMLFLFLIPIQDVFLPHIYGSIINAFEKKTDVLVPFVTVVITMVLLQIGFYLEDWHDSFLYPKLQDFLRGKLLTKILNKYETSYQDLNVGEIISVFSKAPVTMTLWFERMKNSIIPLIITFVVAVIYFLRIDVSIGIALLVLCTTFLAIMLAAPRGCHDVTFNRDKSLNEIHEEIDDLLRNLFSIYGQGQKENELIRTKEFESIHSSLFKSTIKCIFKYKIWIMPFCIGFLCFFMYKSYIMYTTNQLDSGKFVPMFIIVLYILSSMIYTNDQFRDIVFDWGIINATDNIIESSSSPRQSSYPDIQMPTTGLGLFNVDFKYGTSRHNVLNKLNIHINENEKVVIMGDIGCGKSTVLKLLLKYYEPHNGVIYWRGQSYNDIDSRQLRRNIGYVPQTPILFNRSVLENIAYGNNFSRHEIVTILNDYGIMKEFDNLEMGLDTAIGKNGSRLSGGQRQLVWCLRVLLNNPEVLILDEPTSSIDHKTKDTLNRLLDVVMKDKIVIMVTHDEYLLQRADRLIVMEKGSVAKNMYIKKA